MTDVQIATEMLSTIRRIPNEVLKTSLVKELAQKLDVSEDALLVEMKKAGSGLQRMAKSKSAKTTASQPPKAVPMLEKLLLGLFLISPDMWEKGKEKMGSKDFMNEDARCVADLVLKAGHWDEIQPAKILNRIQEQEGASLLIRQAVHEVENIKDTERAFEDCMSRLEEAREKVKINRLKEQIADCERASDQENLSKLLHELMQCSKRGK